jgi:rubredoxin
MAAVLYTKAEPDGNLEPVTVKVGEYKTAVYCENCGCGKTHNAPMVIVQAKGTGYTSTACPECGMSKLILNQ